MSGAQSVIPNSSVPSATLPHDGNDDTVIPLFLGLLYHSPSMLDAFGVKQKVTTPKTWNLPRNADGLVGEGGGSFADFVVNANHCAFAADAVKIVQCLPWGCF